jgi:hypothetical protein
VFRALRVFIAILRSQAASLRSRQLTRADSLNLHGQ